MPTLGQDTDNVYARGQWRPRRGDPNKDYSLLTRDQLAPLVDSAISKYNTKDYPINRDDIFRLIDIESGGDTNATSKKGARGVMQVMPSTASNALKRDPDTLWDPAMGVEAGIQHWASLLQQTKGDRQKAAMAFNGGYEGTTPGSKHYNGADKSAENLDYVTKFSEGRTFGPGGHGGKGGPYSFAPGGSPSSPTASAPASTGVSSSIFDLTSPSSTPTTQSSILDLMSPTGSPANASYGAPTTQAQAAPTTVEDQMILGGQQLSTVPEPFIPTLASLSSSIPTVGEAMASLRAPQPKSLGMEGNPVSRFFGGIKNSFNNPFPPNKALTPDQLNQVSSSGRLSNALSMRDMAESQKAYIDLMLKGNPKPLLKATKGLSRPIAMDFFEQGAANQGDNLTADTYDRASRAMEMNINKVGAEVGKEDRMTKALAQFAKDTEGMKPDSPEYLMALSRLDAAQGDAAEAQAASDRGGDPGAARASRNAAGVAAETDRQTAIMNNLNAQDVNASANPNRSITLNDLESRQRRAAANQGPPLTDQETRDVGYGRTLQANLDDLIARVKDAQASFALSQSNHIPPDPNVLQSLSSMATAMSTAMAKTTNKNLQEEFGARLTTITSQIDALAGLGNPIADAIRDQGSAAAEAEAADSRPWSERFGSGLGSVSSYLGGQTGASTSDPIAYDLIRVALSQAKPDSFTTNMIRGFQASKKKAKKK